jgi:hypothetical protein
MLPLSFGAVYRFAERLTFLFRLADGRRPSFDGHTVDDDGAPTKVVSG